MNNSTVAANFQVIVGSPEYYTMFSMNIVELFGHLFFDCPFSALNFYLILKTAILHPNLKFILLCQSCCFFLRGIFRFCLVSTRLLLNDMMYTNWLSIAVNLPMYFRNMLSHMLVLERVLATVLVKRYEMWSGNWCFSLTWFCFVTIFTVLNSIPLGLNSTIVNFSSQTFVIFAGILEITAFFWLLKYNIFTYERNKLNQKQQNLSERYQLTENIRTVKQLLPALFLHLLINFIAWISYLIGFLNMLRGKPYSFGDYLYGSCVTYTTITFLSFMVELSMLICHPFLKRDLHILLTNWKRHYFLCKTTNLHDNNVTPSTSAVNDIDVPTRARTLTMPNTFQLTDIRGKKLVIARQDESNAHFKTLEQSWNH